MKTVFIEQWHKVFYAREQDQTHQQQCQFCVHKCEVTRTQRLGKSVYMMKFLHVTQNNILTLDAGTGVQNVEWSMDSAFGVHSDFKSHTGATVTFEGRKDLEIGVSAKQKLNTESSMTAELVGVDCALPLALWVPLFLGEQGCAEKKNATNQDDKSATLLAKNGNASSGKRSQALNV